MPATRSEWIIGQGECVPPKRPTRRQSIDYIDGSNDRSNWTATDHLPPAFPQRRASIYSTKRTGSASKSVRFSPSPIIIKTAATTMTEDEISSFWWNADEMAYFYQRAWQTVQSLLAVSNRKTKPNTNSSLMGEKHHTKLIWYRRSNALGGIYNLATDLGSQYVPSNMSDAFRQQLEYYALLLRNDWIGVNNYDSSIIGNTIREVTVQELDGTPRGLEQHYLRRVNVHHAARYRGKIIACYRTHTYSDDQIAQLSRRCTNNAIIFAQLLGYADAMAISGQPNLNSINISGNNKWKHKPVDSVKHSSLSISCVEPLINISARTA
jgi:hypothetical protein